MMPPLILCSNTRFRFGTRPYLRIIIRSFREGIGAFSGMSPLYLRFDCSMQYRAFACLAALPTEDTYIQFPSALRWTPLPMTNTSLLKSVFGTYTSSTYTCPDTVKKEARWLPFLLNRICFN